MLKSFQYIIAHRQNRSRSTVSILNPSSIFNFYSSSLLLDSRLCMIRTFSSCCILSSNPSFKTNHVTSIELLGKCTIM